MGTAVRLQIYKCAVCGNMVEVLIAGGGELVCCGQSMILQVENTVDASKEKHVPVIDKLSDGIKIRVGSIAHPMEEKHYIQWIEAISGDKVYREFLKPGVLPEAVFKLLEGTITAREYCNLHGLWKA